MHDLRGYVRYRFRSVEEDVDVLFEGEADWVRSLVKELGLDGVGWMMPLAVDSINLSSSGLSDDSSLELSGKPKDMGPEPDPSRIPVIRRPIGELNLAAKLAEVGLEKPVRPTPEDLRDELDELEKPLPTRDPMSTDPMAEAWLKELLRIVVRTYGITAISTENIELAATDLLGDREDLELELWLESLFRGGKLVKVHGGDETGWGPSPGWLSRTL
jgi:hypothetical protein